jgi:hypothetical protein
MITLILTEAEVNEIRKALSWAEQSHRKYGFKALENLVADLRSKINDVVLDANDMLV